MKSKTGGFPIGIRRGWGDWQKRSVRELAVWARDNGFEFLDLMNVTSDELAILRDVGVGIGSADLLDFPKLMAEDAEFRGRLISRNVEYVKQLAGAGVRAFFTCIIPGDPARKRSENYKLAVQCFAPIARACESAGAHMVVEGYPGAGPHYGNLCCTPETLRPFLRDVGPGAAVNYDPSHLIRLGVDHVRFLLEFAARVKHVHAKDTEVFPEALYEHGTQSAAFATPHGFGEWTWRYTLPGLGIARWNEILAILRSSNYVGGISIELEDEGFNGTERGEKEGFIRSRDFLASV